MATMTISDVIPYALAATPPSLIALVSGHDSSDTLLAGAGSGALSVLAVAAVRLRAAHKEHLAAQRDRWDAEDRHQSNAAEHRQAERLQWQQANTQSRDIEAAVGRLHVVVDRR